MMWKRFNMKLERRMFTHHQEHRVWLKQIWRLMVCKCSSPRPRVSHLWWPGDSWSPLHSLSPQIFLLWKITVIYYIDYILYIIYYIQYSDTGMDKSSLKLNFKHQEDVEETIENLEWLCEKVSFLIQFWTLFEILVNWSHFTNEFSALAISQFRLECEANQWLWNNFQVKGITMKDSEGVIKRYFSKSRSCKASRYLEGILEIYCIGLKYGKVWGIWTFSIISWTN